MLLLYYCNGIFLFCRIHTFTSVKNLNSSSTTACMYTLFAATLIKYTLTEMCFMNANCLALPYLNCTDMDMDFQF